MSKQQVDRHRDASGPVRQEVANPLYERHASAPYDPLYSAEAGGRATGDALRDPRFPRWMRITGLIAAAAFLGALVIGLVEVVRFAV